MQSDKHRSRGNLQTQTCPSDCQMEKCDSSLHKMRLHCSGVQWRCALHHCMQHFALLLLMYGLDEAATPWKLIPWSSPHTDLDLIWRPYEDWRCVAIDSAESYRPLRTMRLSIGWPHSIILCGLPPRGWDAVVPNRCHFVIPLTAEIFHDWTCWQVASCMPRCLLLYTCGHGSDWSTWFQ